MPGRIVKNKDGVAVLETSCEVCAAPACWGFGGLWACAEHRQQVEAQWVADGMALSSEGKR
jgi:hypothetical protein